MERPDSQPPQILAGKPIIKGTRLSVEFILDELGRDGVSVESFLQGYDGYISREDIQACREFAATGARLYVTTWAELDGWMDGRTPGVCIICRDC